MDTCPSSPLFNSPKKNYYESHQDSSANIQQLESVVQHQKQLLFQQYQQLQFQNQQLSFLSQQVRILSKQLSERQEKPSPYGNFLIQDMVNEYLESFSSLKTKRTYEEGFTQLFLQQFLNPRTTLREFSQLNFEYILDDIRKNYKCKRKGSQEWTLANENTKQLRAAMFVSFSAFLQRRTEGYIKKVVPNKFGGNKTFGYRRERTIASKLSNEQVRGFLACLKSFSQKAFLFASLQILGAKRVSEVINLRIEDLDFANNRVNFKILKNKGVERDPIAIYLTQNIYCELREFVKDRRKGFVFTKDKADDETAITKSQVSKLYQRGWNLVSVGTNKTNPLPFSPRMITHSLRACGITYLFEKKVDSQLIKGVTGHQSGDMVNYYNTDRNSNISKTIHILDLS